jgi:hypothetical protein
LIVKNHHRRERDKSAPTKCLRSVVFIIASCAWMGLV